VGGHWGRQLLLMLVYLHQLIKERLVELLLVSVLLVLVLLLLLFVEVELEGLLLRCRHFLLFFALFQRWHSSCLRARRITYHGLLLLVLLALL
jgi:hypothetical protein